MRRSTIYLCVGAVTALAAAACRDTGVEPNRSANPFSASIASSFSRGNASRDRKLITTLELSPNGGTYHVGDFDVVIPAGAVCDPATTNYGARYWDEDCAPANRSITVNVVAEKRRGQVSVDFQPDLRFRPSAGWARIETRAFSDLLTSDAVRQLSATSPYFSQFLILYAPTGQSARIDEARSLGDPSMLTHVDRNSGVVWRRVKHFSGYITAGFTCDPTLQTDTQQCPDPNDLPGMGGNSTSVVSTSLLLMTSVVVDQ